MREVCSLMKEANLNKNEVATFLSLKFMVLACAMRLSRSALNLTSGYNPGMSSSSKASGRSLSVTFSACSSRPLVTSGSSWLVDKSASAPVLTTTCEFPATLIDSAFSRAATLVEVRRRES